MKYISCIESLSLSVIGALCLEAVGFQVEARGQTLQACANDINSVTALSFVITV